MSDSPLRLAANSPFKKYELETSNCILQDNMCWKYYKCNKNILNKIIQILKCISNTKYNTYFQVFARAFGQGSAKYHITSLAEVKYVLKILVFQILSSTVYYPAYMYTDWHDCNYIPCRFVGWSKITAVHWRNGLWTVVRGFDFHPFSVTWRRCAKLFPRMYSWFSPRCM